MNKELWVNLIMGIIGVAIFIALWPIIKWLALIILALFVIAVLYVYFKSRKIKKDIEADPNAYYSNVNFSNKDAIDVEYKEKVVSQPEDE